MGETGRPTIIAGNWKMHKTGAETAAFIRRVAEHVSSRAYDCEIVLAPPFTALAAAAAAAKGTPVQLAAQNVHWEPKGAFTAEISVEMLREHDVRWAIIGHSERRHVFGETDEMVARRLRAAIDGGLRAILCIGETLEQREAGQTLEVNRRQLRSALEGIESKTWNGQAIAYEPVWAIGTGKTATPDQAQEVQGMIRTELAALYDAQTAARTPILYGGSVKPENIAELLSRPDVDGGLIGGASLEADSYLKLLENSGKRV